MRKNLEKFLYGIVVFIAVTIVVIWIGWVDLYQAVVFLFQWIIIPGIIILIFLLGWVIAAATEDEEGRQFSAYAGLFSGLVLFAIYAISQLRSISNVSFNLAEITGFLLLPSLIGFALGFLLLFAVNAVSGTRAIGFMCLLLSASSSIALFNYIFVAEGRAAFLYLTLGLALGVLLNIMFFPTLAEDL